MNNLAAVSRLCNAIANTFYPDKSTIEFALFNEGVDATAEATPKDPVIFRVAARLVKGYVESGRSEGGISLSVRSEEAIKQSLSVWCNVYGLDAEEELSAFFQILEGGSNLW